MRLKLGICFYWLTFILHLSKLVVPHSIESQYIVDLLQYVIVDDNTHASPNALQPIPGSNNHSTAYIFQGAHRNVEVAPEVLRSLQSLLHSQGEFTILVALKQQSNNSGSIITFSVDKNRYLELESSGRRQELRLHYHSHHQPHFHSLTFPVRVTDDHWHQVALTISTHFITLYIDCQKVHERQISNLDLSHITEQGSKVQLWLGQRDATSAHFKGAMEYVKLVIFPQGQLVQCPHASIPCPTCSQFYQLEHSVQKLHTVVELLSKKLQDTEERLAEVEKCECMQSCAVNGIRYRDGESWQKDHCRTCTCRGGDVTCEKPKCPTPHCMNPVLKEGACCPSCLRHCYYNGRKYDHLEEYTPRECIKCVCQDGHMTCMRLDPQVHCPKLHCPPENQVNVEGECCLFCKGTDYCSMGHDCHANATCYNLETKYTCQCNEGYEGDGHTCEDRDECTTEGGLIGHHCHSNTYCVNTAGSYECQCLPGYVREDRYACRELNECMERLDECHDNAICINTEGSYACYCLPGYHGNGTTCQPVCEESCENGGSCVSPNVCVCRPGFVGTSCQIDVDECKKGVAHCHPNSDCINIPGHYYCQCKKGYHSNHHDNLNGLLCRDVNECEGWGSGHQCPEGTQCHNTAGGYECVCLEEASCNAACQLDGEFHANGSAWVPPDDKCSQCLCKDGEVHCIRKECRCGSGFDDPQCCPQCDVGLQCRHQRLPMTYYSGDTWTYHCQTCECLNGEVDCWALECPPLSCRKVIHEDGDCCPRCVEDSPCTIPIHTGDDDDVPSPMSMVCFFDGKKYLSGDDWLVTWDICSTCTCQAGQICCIYNDTCAAIRKSSDSTRPRVSSLDQSVYYADNEEYEQAMEQELAQARQRQYLQRVIENRDNPQAEYDRREYRIQGQGQREEYTLEDDEEGMNPGPNSGYSIQGAPSRAMPHSSHTGQPRGYHGYNFRGYNANHGRQQPNTRGLSSGNTGSANHYIPEHHLVDTNRRLQVSSDQPNEQGHRTLNTRPQGRHLFAPSRPNDRSLGSIEGQSLSQTVSPSPGLISTTLSQQDKKQRKSRRQRGRGSRRSRGRSGRRKGRKRDPRETLLSSGERSSPLLEVELEQLRYEQRSTDTDYLTKSKVRKRTSSEYERQNFDGGG